MKGWEQIEGDERKGTTRGRGRDKGEKRR